MLRLKGLRLGKSRLCAQGQGKKGFLLLEVLVSVAVITVGLIYIIRSFSISTRAIATSRDYIKAVSLLEEKLWEFEETRQIESGEDRDYFRDDRRFTWQLSAETEEEIPINKTQLKVFWEEKNRKQRLSVTTYLWNKED